MTREAYPALNELQLREGTPLFRLRILRDQSWSLVEGYSRQISELEQKKQALDAELRRATIDTISVEDYAAAHAESELLGKTIAARQQSKREAVSNAEHFNHEFKFGVTEYQNALLRWNQGTYLSTGEEAELRSLLNRYSSPE